jgi:hypothetical protein
VHTVFLMTSQDVNMGVLMVGMIKCIEVREFPPERTWIPREGVESNLVDEDSYDLRND